MKPMLFFGGPILTMDGPERPQAVLVKEGRIAQVGTLRDCVVHAEDAVSFDLQGRALLPAFLDPHSHLTALANTLRLAALEGAKSFDEIAERLTDFIRANPDTPGGWVNGFGYDHNQLREGRHPTRELLDAVCADRPVLIAHASGHMGAANSAALRALGIDENTPDPEGGRIGRKADGRTPSGYLEETAFTSASAKIPQPSAEQRLALLEKAQQIYFANGITTIQDGLTRQREWELLRTASERGVLRADVVSYLDLQQCRALAREFADYRSYHGRLRIGGYKIFLDGSPQGRTAWISQPYLGEPAGERGYPIHTDAAVEQFMTEALEDHTQILAHCNGDEAARQMLDGYAAALKKTGLPGVRPVMIHAQLLRPDQLPRLRELGVIASFFVAHTWHWGDTHLRNLGPERAGRISPVGSALRQGVCYTFHQDSPVLPPDMIDTLFCAVNRVTRAGVRLAAEERLSVPDALAGMTRNAAFQYGEEEQKGCIRPGMRADLVLLSEDPQAVPAAELRRLRVLRTFREGEALWQAEENA